MNIKTAIFFASIVVAQGVYFTAHAADQTTKASKCTTCSTKKPCTCK